MSILGNMALGILKRRKFKNKDKIPPVFRVNILRVKRWNFAWFFNLITSQIIWAGVGRIAVLVLT